MADHRGSLDCRESRRKTILVDNTFIIEQETAVKKDTKGPRR